MVDAEKPRRVIDVLLAISVLILTVCVGLEIARQRVLVSPELPGPPDVDVAGVDAFAVAGTAGATGGVAQADVLVVPPMLAEPTTTPVVPGQRIPHSGLDSPSDVRDVLRAQTQDLRKEVAADSLNPAKKRALTLTQEEILEIERDERLIF